MWDELWADLNKSPRGKGKNKIFGSLVAKYAEPHRRYHNITHISQCLYTLDMVYTTGLIHKFDDYVHARLAIWFHDAIYRMDGNDSNELESYWYAVDCIGVKYVNENLLRDTILATNHKTDLKSIQRIPRLVADIDISILGSPKPLYRAYSSAIRAEYEHIPDDVYISKRLEFLRRTLIRHENFGLYYNEIFHTLNDQTSENLTNEITELNELMARLYGK